MKTINLFFVFLISSLYLVSSFYWSQSFYIDGDTLSYLTNYNNISIIRNPNGIEFVLTIIMRICSYFELSFREFCFVLLMFWYPLIILISYNIYRSPILILALFFFFTPKFYENALFLIRSFLSISFLFSFLFIKGYKRFVFLILAFFSHVSIMIFYLMMNKRLYDFYFKSKLRSVFLIFLACIVSKIITFDLLSMINFNYLYGILPSDVYRKLVFYHEIKSVTSANPIIILLVIVVGLLLTYAKKINKDLDTLIFSQVLICIAFSNIIHISNRVGVIAFMFCIPLFFYYLNVILKYNYGR